MLSNGEEAGKGNQLVKDTYPLLANSGLNFIGNVEGKELFGGEVDVVVTDGFTGNVMLKSVEAVAKLMIDTLQYRAESHARSPSWARLWQCRPSNAAKNDGSRKKLALRPLLGIDGLVFVGHGRSNAQALVSAIRVARERSQLRSSRRYAAAHPATPGSI